MCGWNDETRMTERVHRVRYPCVFVSPSSFVHSSFGFRDYLATLTERRYRREVKIARWFVAVLAAIATSLLAADELALRLQPALDAITPDGLLAHIKILASDEFEGRAPGTKGEELSVKSITDQFKQVGLKPGNCTEHTRRKFRWPESGASRK